MKYIINVAYIACLCLLASCAKYSYPVTTYNGNQIPQTLLDSSAQMIKPGDKIKVQSFNNLSTVMSEMTAANTASSNTTLPEFETWVDHDGYAALPKAGKVRLVGLTQKQAAATIENAYRGIIKDPSFNVFLSNKSVKVLGAVNKQGLYYMERENQTLAEVLAMAQGVKYENMGKKLQIIRTMPNGDAQTMEFNISPEELGNPRLNAIVVRENDIVYVLPSRASVNSPKYQQLSGYLTPLSLLVNAAVLFITISK